MKTTLLLLSLLLSSFSLWAAESHVLITITQGGKPLADDVDGFYYLYPPGNHADAVEYTRSGGSVEIAPGTYDICIELTQGEAVKKNCFPNQIIAGEVNKTYDMSLPAARVIYHLTNGGVDVGGKGMFTIFKQGETDNYVTYTFSGEKISVPEGIYDIALDFKDGDSEKRIWEKGVKLTGTFEKTVDFGVGLTRVTYTITNKGIDVGGKGTFTLYKPGEKKDYVGYANSKGTVTAASGTYDIKFDFQGEVEQEIWLSNQKLEGPVTKTFEMGINIATLKVTATDKGIDVKDKAYCALYAPGDREVANFIVNSHSGETANVLKGTYDLGIQYTSDTGVTIQKWIPGLVVQDNMEKTVVMDTPMAEVVFHITRDGKPLPQAWCGLYSGGQNTDAVAKANSDTTLKTAEGNYDVGCFYSDQGVVTNKWLTSQTVKGKTEIAIVLDSKVASLTVTAPATTVANTTSTTTTTTTTTTTSPSNPNIEIILDASGSMIAKVGSGKTRMQTAKDVLTNLINSWPDSANAQVALRVYGTAPKTPKNCQDSTLAIPRGPLNKAQLIKTITDIKQSGYTPIAYNLEKAAADFPAQGNNSIILVTDGIESCGGDPCSVSTKLSSQGLLTQAFVVGFGVETDKQSKLQCIGKYYSAQNETELQTALSQILTQSLKAQSGSVTIYPVGNKTKFAARGALGEKLTVPAGNYDVDIVVGDKKISWANFALVGDRTSPATDKAP